MLEPMTDNGVISGVVAVMYVVLSRAEIHVPYREISSFQRICDAIAEVWHKPRSV